MFPQAELQKPKGFSENEARNNTSINIVLIFLPITFVQLKYYCLMLLKAKLFATLLLLFDIFQML